MALKFSDKDANQIDVRDDNNWQDDHEDDSPWDICLEENKPIESSDNGRDGEHTRKRDDEGGMSEANFPITFDTHVEADDSSSSTDSSW